MYNTIHKAKDDGKLSALAACSCTEKHRKDALLCVFVFPSIVNNRQMINLLTVLDVFYLFVSENYVTVKYKTRRGTKRNRITMKKAFLIKVSWSDSAVGLD
jgi:hypothetical protein